MTLKVTDGPAADTGAATGAPSPTRIERTAPVLASRDRFGMSVHPSVHLVQVSRCVVAEHVQELVVMHLPVSREIRREAARAVSRPAEARLHPQLPDGSRHAAAVDRVRGGIAVLLAMWHDQCAVAYLRDVDHVARIASYCLAQTPTARTLRAMLVAMAPDISAPYVVGATLEAILDQLASGVALYDASGRMVRLNAAGERITRQPVRAGETMGDRLLRFHMRDIYGAPMPVADSPSGRALRGAVVSQMECIIDGQHGQDTWLRCSAAPLKDEHDIIQGAAVIFDDITEQRILSREEARQRSLAEAMIEHTFSGMAVFDVSDAFRCTPP